MTRAILTLLVGLSLAGCGAGSVADEGGADGLAAGLVVAGRGDASDSACHVVLREVARVAGTAGGYQTACASGKCWAVFEGTIDLSSEAAAEAAFVGVTYRSSVDNYAAWRQARATAVAGAPKGFQRFRFSMSQYTLDPGMSGTSLSRTRIELAAYLEAPTGGRLWDHNRIPGALDNYVLDASNGWAIRSDAAVCTPRAARSEIEFLAGWTQAQHGALVAGGALSVRYDPARLTACRSTHNGYAGFGIQGKVRFSPGGEVLDLGRLSFSGPMGQPTLTPTWMPFEVSIPARATAAEMWFVNTDVSGCQAYDSNFGSNHRFEVLAQPPAAPTWAGNWGNGFNRECAHVAGLAEPTPLGSWNRERSCLWVDAEVYVPGLTDRLERPDRVAAQVEYQVDGGEKRVAWLAYAGRAGNNYRWRWDLSREEMSRTFWNAYAFSFRFSTDGATWIRTGAADAPQGGADRTLVRDASWCASGWPGCP